MLLQEGLREVTEGLRFEVVEMLLGSQTIQSEVVECEETIAVRKRHKFLLKFLNIYIKFHF